MSANDTNEPTENFEDETREGADQLREEVSELRRSASDAATQLRDSTDAYVHENPWAVVSLVALFAFTFGLLLGSRRD